RARGRRDCVRFRRRTVPIGVGDGGGEQRAHPRCDPRRAVRGTIPANLMRALVLVAAVASAGAVCGQCRVPLEQVQATLAVQGFDGWLLASDGDDNAIAVFIAGPTRAPAKRWAYFIPVTGTPTLLVSASDAAAFAGSPTQVRSDAELDRAI